MTETELILWAALRRKALGYRFRRQHPVGPFVVDFYCPEVRLCVEVDGGTHFEDDVTLRADEERTRFLEENGHEVLRFMNEDVRYTLDDVLNAIRQRCDELTVFRQSTS